MKWIQDIPIKKKLLVVTLITTGLALVLACLAFVFYQFVSSRQSVAESAATLAKVIASNSTAALAFQIQEDAEEVLSALRAEPNVAAAILYDAEGNVFAAYWAREDAVRTAPGIEADGLAFRSSYLALFEPVQANTRLGTLYLRYDLRALYARMGWYVLISVLILAGASVLALSLSGGLQRSISRPILELATTARSISTGENYGARAKKFGNDEMGELTDDVNAMLTRIEDQNRNLRRSEEKYRRLSLELEDRVRERTAELAVVNKDLEAFAYSVSHDLRAPIRHINSYAKVLDEDFVSEMDTEGRRYLRRISEVAINMGSLVDDLLKLSRVGRQELTRETVALDSIVREVVDELAPEMENREIEWRIAPLPKAECDRGLIKQVFINLIANAVKYSRPRKQAVIEVGCAPIDGRPTVFVRDNGVGFDMQYVKNLFGVFQRLHDASEFEGTGIGLALVHRILRKHDGDIWPEAQPDKGATFYFTFPGIKT